MKTKEDSILGPFPTIFEKTRIFWKTHFTFSLFVDLDGCTDF